MSRWRGNFSDGHNQGRSWHLLAPRSVGLLMNPENFWRALRAGAIGCLVSAVVAAPQAMKFQFGSAAAREGWTAVSADAVYSAEKGFGFEPGAKLTADDTGKSLTSVTPFYFSAHVPAEGNYVVTVTLAGGASGTATTIKAELRRLVVEQWKIGAGKTAQRSFIVNTRTPKIAATGDIKEGIVKLKAPRETIQEAWAWDDAITLEFNGLPVVISSVEIEPVAVPTIFLLGDSTVCDQSKEPYNSWGQMLPRFFGNDVAIANHGESGETYRDSIGRRRIDKILSVMKPGDYLLMQFGHNDQKQIAAKTGGPFTTYKEEIRKHVELVRAHGGVPVIVTPMERRGFDEQGHVKPSLSEYAEAARQAAAELKVACIDLNSMSIPFYEALGPDKSAAAFAQPEPGKVDGTHHDNYGSYELAKCIAQSIRAQSLPIAKYLAPDFKGFDPAKPDSLETFAVPTSPSFTNQRPLGD